jgi:hypothetical protein
VINTTTTGFTQPALSASVPAVFASTAGMYLGQALQVATGGYYAVSLIADGTHATLVNLGYPGNAAPGTVIGNGVAVTSYAVLPKEALRQLFAAFTPYQSTSVVWANDPQPIVGDCDAAKITLQLMSISQNGIDDFTQQYNDTGNPATSTLTSTTVGQRDVVIQVKVEVYDFTIEACEVLDFMQFMFRAASTTFGYAALNAVGLAWADNTKAVQLPTSYDNRVVSCASMDVQFNALANFQFTDQPGLGWVDTVIAPAGTFNV